MQTKKRKRQVLTDPVMSSWSSRRRRSSRRRTPSRAPPAAAAKRDWATLHDDALLAIFGRLGHLDILLSAELTCASWRRVAVHEPTLWRRIDMRNTSADVRSLSRSRRAWMAMARAAVGRSAGQCVSFCGPVDSDFLVYLAVSSPSLRSLHLTSFLYPPPIRESAGWVIPKLPMLEHLVLSDHARRYYMYGQRGTRLWVSLHKIIMDLD